jgi:hypothetical protein
MGPAPELEITLNFVNKSSSVGGTFKLPGYMAGIFLFLQYHFGT